MAILELKSRLKTNPLNLQCITIMSIHGHIGTCICINWHQIDTLNLDHFHTRFDIFITCSIEVVQICQPINSTTLTNLCGMLHIMDGTIPFWSLGGEGDITIMVINGILKLRTKICHQMPLGKGTLAHENTFHCYFGVLEMCHLISRVKQMVIVNDPGYNRWMNL